jgi:hemoglobin
VGVVGVVDGGEGVVAVGISIELDRAFGDGDATFQALGRESGIRSLVESFYRLMDSLEATQRIRRLHPSDLSESIEKLICFLCGWTGGPKRYAEVYRPIRIPQAHAHLPVGESERDAWLLCMKQALDEQPYGEDLKRYMLEELYRPAERIRQVARVR